jgi:hypothetical protein
MPLADRCWGYNQVGALVSATVSAGEFDALPLVCGTEREFGYKVDLVSSVAGKLQRIDHLDRIRALPSFMSFDLLPKPGERMQVTIDCFTACGSISLVNSDKEQLMDDVATVRELEKTMWVRLKLEGPKLKLQFASTIRRSCSLSSPPCSLCRSPRCSVSHSTRRDLRSVPFTSLFVELAPSRDTNAMQCAWLQPVS